MKQCGLIMKNGNGDRAKGVSKRKHHWNEQRQFWGERCRRMWEGEKGGVKGTQRVSDEVFQGSEIKRRSEESRFERKGTRMRFGARAVDPMRPFDDKAGE